ncbi:Hypothetical predicted protein, partial [Paramuricea clavata]
ETQHAVSSSTTLPARETISTTTSTLKRTGGLTIQPTTTLKKTGGLTIQPTTTSKPKKTGGLTTQPTKHVNVKSSESLCDWENAVCRIERHENSQSHRVASSAMFNRSDTKNRTDNKLLEQQKAEVA